MILCSWDAKKGNIWQMGHLCNTLCWYPQFVLHTTGKMKSETSVVRYNWICIYLYTQYIHTIKRALNIKQFLDLSSLNVQDLICHWSSEYACSLGTLLITCFRGCLLLLSYRNQNLAPSYQNGIYKWGSIPLPTRKMNFSQVCVVYLK